MDESVDRSADDPPIVARVQRGSGEVYVGPAVFPRLGTGSGRRRRADDSNARQKRQRVWRLVSDRGLIMVTSFDRIDVGDQTLERAARRLRDRHHRRFEDDCDFVILREERNPGLIHVFSVPYPAEDQDVVTDLFPVTGPDPRVRVLTDADELKDVVYDACNVFWWKVRGVDLHVMSRTGPRVVIEEHARTLPEGLEIVERIVAPDVLRVDRIQCFGPRSRAHGRTRPSIPVRVLRPRTRQADSDPVEGSAGLGNA